jgi:hypothetical protein
MSSTIKKVEINNNKILYFLFVIIIYLLVKIHIVKSFHLSVAKQITNILRI